MGNRSTDQRIWYGEARCRQRTGNGLGGTCVDTELRTMLPVCCYWAVVEAARWTSDVVGFAVGESRLAVGLGPGANRCRLGGEDSLSGSSVENGRVYCVMSWTPWVRQAKYRTV